MESGKFQTEQTISAPESENFKTGQKITTKAKNLPFITHKGIFYRIQGKLYVMHNTIGLNVNIEGFEDFIKEREILEVEDTELCGLSLAEITKRYSKLEKQKFNLITNNCEHFVSDMMGTESKSESLESVGKMVAIFAAVFIVGSVMRLI